MSVPKQDQRTLMQIEADVSNDGVLTAKLPDRFRGKHVRISIHAEEEQAPAQWTALSVILDEIEAEDIPRRSHQEILKALREFRESE